MFGAFIGDIVGSKYEFNNIKTKKFPLFSRGCDYTDDTIMTVAVAKAIMLSYQEQFEKSENGKGFQEFLVEIMQDYGRRYPNPTGGRLWWQLCQMALSIKSETLWKLWKWFRNACFSLRFGSSYHGRSISLGSCKCLCQS